MDSSPGTWLADLCARSRALARAWPACGWMQCMISTASHGCRRSSPMAGSSHAPKHPRANARRPRVRRSVMRTSHGRSPKPPSCSFASIRRARRTLARLERRHGKGKALTVLAHTWARAAYDMWKRDTAFDLDKFFQESGVEWASLPPHGTPRGSAGIPRAYLAHTLRLGTRMRA